MKVLVTGAEGYIGSHLCQMIQKTRPDIEVYRSEWVDVDVREYYSVLRQWGETEFHTVVHLAALVRVGESVKDPIDYYETNVTGTLNVLRLLNYRNFIFASTGSASSPSNPYAYSKLMAESIIKQKLGENYHTIFRFYNVIGTDGHPATNPDGLFYNLKNAITSGDFSLYGTDYDTKDGTAVREYVHVNDICRAIIKAIDKPSNSIENLAYGDTRTVQEIVDIFKKVNNVDFKVNRCPRREGDLAENYLKNPSTYMERNYTYEEMLKL